MKPDGARHDPSTGLAGREMRLDGRTHLDCEAAVDERGQPVDSDATFRLGGIVADWKVRLDRRHVRST